MNSEWAIETVGLTKRYRQLVAVNGLDLKVRRGALCGFLGPNGAGKTTTIRMLLGLVEPSAGTARILGHDIADRRALCQNVAAIVETPTFYPFLSGLENLRVLARSAWKEVPRNRPAELLERLGLCDRAKDRVSAYSMGMKQRLGIAATLLTDPDVLFLDEPTNGLDPAGVQEVRTFLATLTREGKTVFISSHQLGEMEKICTEVVIVQRGEKKLESTLEDWLREGRRLAIRATPMAMAEKVLSRYPDLRASNDELSVRVDRAAIPEVVRALVAEGVEVFAVEERLPSLEARFLELTRVAS